MPRLSYKKNRLFFIRRSLNVLIDICFISIFILAIIGLFFTVRTTINYILSFEGYLGDVLSASVSLIVFLLPLISSIRAFLINHLNHFKQKVYIYLCTHKSILSKGVLNFNQGHWNQKPNQSQIIIHAIKILKNKRQGIFAIESLAYGGKTASAMLLLDFIGKNIDLLDLFTSLKNKVLYFDAATESKEILDFLDSSELLLDSILIIDNIHKLNPIRLSGLICKAISNAEVLSGIDKGCLVLLLYQTSSASKTLINELNKLRNSQLNTTFLLEDDTTSINSVNVPSTATNSIDFLCSLITSEQKILRQHLTFLAHVSKSNDIITILMNIANNQDLPKYEEAFTILLTASSLIASFQGYIHNKDLKNALKDFHCPIIIGYKNIHVLKKESFLVDFPLFQSTFLLNEKLANYYKQILFKNDRAKKIYFELAKSLFDRESFESPKKWLYLVACDISYSKSFSSMQKNAYFSCSLEKYSVSYLLNAIETELIIVPDKVQVFSIEIGTLYINNGQWKRAREILKPSVQSQQDKESMWLLQLKIIEADHGTDDRENLRMLNNIINNSTVSFTIFLARFWKHHICMEQGRFSIEELLNLRIMIDEHHEWETHALYDNTLRKLNSDSARTYFLNGHIDYKVFQDIMTLIEPPYIHYINSEISTQKLLLTQAHYIHYDLIYQLGIWGYYQQAKVNLQFQGLALGQILEHALNAYDECIRIYKTGGDKKWRTVQVRRDELALCSNECNFVEIISHLDSFYTYSISNNIGVFIGFCNTMRGKVFALYAVSAMAQGDIVRYDQYMATSLEHLESAISAYTQYGNIYGVMRAKFLHILVSMLNQRSNSYSKKTFERHFSEEIDKLMKICENEGWQREQDVGKYLLKHIKQYNTIVVLLKYYPLILQ